MLDLSTSQTFNPVLTSRRSELIAWVLFGSMVPVVILNQIDSQQVRLGAILLLVFFGLSAVVMTFGNWVDRRTILHLDREKIRFENGLSNAEILWSGIERLEVHQDKISKKVFVFGAHAHFAFRIWGEVVMSEKVRGGVGFEQGNVILETITHKTGLVKNPAENDPSVYYYTRE